MMQVREIYQASKNSKNYAYVPDPPGTVSVPHEIIKFGNRRKRFANFTVIRVITGWQRRNRHMKPIIGKLLMSSDESFRLATRYYATKGEQKW